MRHRRGFSLLAVCLAGVLCAGCEAFDPGLGPDAGAREAIEKAPPGREAGSLAERRLAEAAMRAQAALAALARTSAARTEAPVAAAPLDVPPALQRAVTLDWIGPLETLARSLAEHAGYRFATAGPLPVRPLMVSVAVRDRPLIEVLRDAGLQAGAAAALTVDAARRTVRLDWSARGEEDT